MNYTNPVLSGFYPDPSVCKVGNTYYLVCSSMQYFPGVPLFESPDLVHWSQIGYCLTRQSQIDLSTATSSGGVFAPTIRWHDGRFYMVTTNATTQQHFYVWTDDIHGEWSEPVLVHQNGIDPSLFFEDGKTYFISNGTDDEGISGIVQCEINIETGEKLTPSRTIWQGTGGRFPEGPHLYHIGAYYYLLLAEGGTEYGHMVTYARGNSPYGPFTPYPNNPVLTNRNLGGFRIQGVGHGDLIQDRNGNWQLLHLGFRQSGQWMPYHHLGREVFLTPVQFDTSGWFTAGENGTTAEQFTMDGITAQTPKSTYTFANTNWDKDWCYLRAPHRKNYLLTDTVVTLTGTTTTLYDIASPTWIGLRQKEFNMELCCHLQLEGGEAGITCYMDESNHYDLAIHETEHGYEAILRLNVGDLRTIVKSIPLSGRTATLRIAANPYCYHFNVLTDGEQQFLGMAQSKYLSSEVCSGFTGVLLALYACAAQDTNTATFTDFNISYT